MVARTPRKLKPPAVVDSEKIVLGSILREPDVFPEVKAQLASLDFSTDANVKVFAAMAAVHASNNSPDLVTLHNILHERGESDDTGHAYLAELWESTKTAANWQQHAEMVKRVALRRHQSRIPGELEKYADAPPEIFADVLQRELEKLRGAKATPAAAKWPAPVPVSQLPESGPVADWLMNGLIARGHVTLINAFHKVGKTTFVSHMLRALQSGTPFIGRQTKECRTLYVTEESEALWRGRRDLLGLDDHLHLLCRPMIAKPTYPEWREFVTYIAGLAIGKFDQVAFDTISAFAPWKSENDNAEVVATFLPFVQLAKAGLAVTVFHHHGKAEGGGGRGASAMGDRVDVILEIRRFKPDDNDDRRRTLSGNGRFDEIPKEVVIALEEDGTGYTAVGDYKAEAARDLNDAIRDAMPTSPPGATADEIHTAMPESGRPKVGAVRKALIEGAGQGSWNRTGLGKAPNNPWRFWSEKA